MGCGFLPPSDTTRKDGVVKRAGEPEGGQEAIEGKEIQNIAGEANFAFGQEFTRQNYA